MQSIESLDSVRLSSGYCLIVRVQPTRFSWQSFFHIRVEKQGKASESPAVSGVYSIGNPSLSAPAWMDLNYRSKLRVDDSIVDLSSSGEDVELFGKLGSVIPAGGSMMVAYRMFVGEEQIHKDTREALDLGIPPLLTPLGYLMFRADCGWSFKDWYFAEGGREGPEKLQGFKPISATVKAHAAARLAENLSSFMLMTTIKSDHLVIAARERAESVMLSIQAAAEQ